MTENRSKQHIYMKDLSFSYSKTGVPVLSGLELSIKDGEFRAIVGPNGAGKSTLLRLLTGYLRPAAGEIRIGDRQLTQLSHKARARKIAQVAQRRDDRFNFTVYEMVRMGRLPHVDPMGDLTHSDQTIISRVLEMCNLKELAHRPITALSGGERQRVAIARALAQEPEILLLDEPTTHLDIHYQIQTLQLLRSLNCEQNTTVVMVLHDLNLAAQYCETLTLLSDGEVVESGPPEEVLVPDNIKLAYKTDRVTVTSHPRTEKPVLLPI